MPYKIPLFDLNYDQAEQRAVAEVLQSRWISMGEKTALLERRFADHIGAPHAIALSSCTAALHLAMVILGITQGDEVIVPSLTFVATANAVRYVGATPVFADVTSLDNLSIAPEAVRASITPRTKAVIAMHYGGFACDMTALRKICGEHNLFLVEDAAHAPDSFYGDRRLGSFGDIACFSFFSNKNISCAEGGMLVTSNEEHARRARLLRSHGMTTLSFDRASGHATRYDVVDLGYNYRLDDIRAALVLAQLEKIKEDTQRRAAIRALYVEELRKMPDLIIPYSDFPHSSSNYIFPVILREGGPERRDAVRKSLAGAGIETSVHYPAVHRFSTYAQHKHHLPNTEHATDHEFTLPMHGRLREEEVRQVIEGVKRL